MKQEMDRKDDKLVISTLEFLGKKYLDIRSYYLKDDNFLPGKGITIKTQEEFDFLLKTLNDASDEIRQWLKKDK